MSGTVVVFLGPSLPLAEARALLPGATFLPPARQGDFWRALALEPATLVLIDGVFESVPSVWHREILAALDAGVAVLGASSMGALRAAEMEALGMEGVGEVFRQFRAGTLRDDAEVALLHADAEHGFRPLTVPLVNVRHVARVAEAREVLSSAQARALVEAAEALHYQRRTWVAVLRSLPFARGRAWTAFAAKGLPDVKREDAIACLERARRVGPPPRVPEHPEPSSHARRRRLREGGAGGEGALKKLRARPDANAMTREGLARAVLAAHARSLGLAATRAQVRRVEDAWLRRVGVPRSERMAFFAQVGMDAHEALRLCEDEALALAVLADAPRLFADGPHADEGLAAEARFRGEWP